MVEQREWPGCGAAQRCSSQKKGFSPNGEEYQQNQRKGRKRCTLKTEGTGHSELELKAVGKAPQPRESLPEKKETERPKRGDKTCHPNTRGRRSNKIKLVYETSLSRRGQKTLGIVRLSSRERFENIPTFESAPRAVSLEGSSRPGDRLPRDSSASTWPFREGLKKAFPWVVQGYPLGGRKAKGKSDIMGREG